jgi:8-oxo-dGTP pyrophosphatase MutT (NUDIX family)
LEISSSAPSSSTTATTGSTAAAAAVDAALVAVLSRVLAQWSCLHYNEQQQQHRESSSPVNEEDDVVTVHFLQEEGNRSVVMKKDLLLGESSDETTVHNSLFQDVTDITRSEVVDMVDREGRVLGRAPRHLVHRHNLLHRGVGLFVTRDRPIQEETAAAAAAAAGEQQQQPDLYVHRRAGTKRIFPNLYDMFVGGVSLAGEDSLDTAVREVAEELGIRSGQWSDRLLTCTVCTEHNRCVVDLYSVAHCRSAAAEPIRWQREEVAWGAFVPYATVRAAADRSARRLAARREWPGRHPPVRSSARAAGQAPPPPPPPPSADETREDRDLFRDWATWDFVPDGLLVWEAWLRKMQGAE